MVFYTSKLTEKCIMRLRDRDMRVNFRYNFCKQQKSQKKWKKIKEIKWTERCELWGHFRASFRKITDQTPFCGICDFEFSCLSKDLRSARSVFQNRMNVINRKFRKISEVKIFGNKNRSFQVMKSRKEASQGKSSLHI